MSNQCDCGSGLPVEFLAVGRDWTPAKGKVDVLCFLCAERFDEVGNWWLDYYPWAQLAEIFEREERRVYGT